MEENNAHLPKSCKCMFVIGEKDPHVKRTTAFLFLAAFRSILSVGVNPVIATFGITRTTCLTAWQQPAIQMQFLLRLIYICRFKGWPLYCGQTPLTANWRSNILGKTGSLPPVTISPWHISIRSPYKILNKNLSYHEV